MAGVRDVLVAVVPAGGREQDRAARVEDGADAELVDTQHVVALHLTALLSASAATADPQDPEDQASLEKARRYQRELIGYAVLQSTRPQTLAYALTDSPVGQLAWIVERFKDWTDSDERPEDAVDRDAMLTNVMIYWLHRTAGSSARYYYAGARDWGFGAGAGDGSDGAGHHAA